MNILVTGSAGFIGTHLSHRLESLGHDVYRYDRLEVLEDWQDLPLHDAPTDFIFHLACPVGCRKVMLEPHVYTQIVRGAVAALECAERLKARLVMFSSAEAEYAVTADDLRSEYPRGKKILEEMCWMSNYENIVVIRPHNIVGPGQSAEAGFVLPRFLEAKREGWPLSIFGDGEQERIFTSVHDLVDFCLLLMEKWEDRSVLYEIGNPRNRVSINQLARMIGGPIEHVDGAKAYGIPEYRDMPSRNRIDITPAIKLGWKPKWDLEQIIEELTNERGHDRTQPSTADTAGR